MLNVTEIPSENLERRLGGVARLYGEQAYEIFKQAHVVVVGLGGVGSWAAEALVRSAIGEITLIDFDHISLSNTNRQLQALDGEFGKSKIEVMAQRLQRINPELKIHLIDDFLKPENMDQYLPPDAAILDAADDVSTKQALAVWCRSHDAILTMSGGAGGKVDPGKIEVADLANATHDAMLAKIRAHLRSQHGFEKDPKRKMRIRVVYSSESKVGQSDGRLSCSGYGSTVMVTATFGLFAAAETLKQMMASHKTV
jgi:tRNA A37 threonylcarbamoyladenosine dehydratase